MNDEFDEEVDERFYPRDAGFDRTHRPFIDRGWEHGRPLEGFEPKEWRIQPMRSEWLAHWAVIIAVVIAGGLAIASLVLALRSAV